MQKQWEQSLIILLLVNTGWDSSLGRISIVYAVTTLLKLGVIFFTNIKGIMSIKAQEKIQ